ncbi:MAG: S-layer homology domain-containing protein, partial [Oscillospiraceae bacterium]
MKKTLALIIAITVMLSNFVVVGAEGTNANNDNNLYLNRIQALGILSGEIDNGELISRGRMADVVAKMFYVTDNSTDMGQIFSDVPPEHTYFDGITKAYLTGAMKGNGDGTFTPEAKMTYAEAAKTFVSLIGHQFIAEEKGGYPNGYWTVATQKGIVRGSNKMEDPVVMSDFVNMIYETLDTPVMKATYTDTDKSYQIDENHTLLGDMLDKKKLAFTTGVITSDGITHINGTRDKNDEVICLDDKEFKNNGVDASRLLGQTVEYWYTTDSLKSEVVSAYPYRDSNTVFTYDAGDVENISMSGITVKKDRSSIVRKLSDEFSFVYNMAGVDNFIENDLKLKNGNITIVDNNRDGKFDVLFFHEKNSYVVDNTSKKGYNIEYKTYIGQDEQGLHIDDLDDMITYVVRDTEGNKISSEAISTNSVVSVEKSKDNKIINVVLTKNIVDGVVESTRENGKYITIDGNEYEAITKMDGSVVNLDVEVGMTVSLFLNEDKKAVYADCGNSKNGVYAYVVGLAKDGGLENNWTIRTVTAGNLGSIQGQLYYWVRDRMIQNESIFEYRISSKVRLDNIKYNEKDLNNKILEYKNQVVNIEFNADGEVKSMKKMVPMFEYTEGVFKHDTQSMTQPGLVVPGYENPAILLSGGVKGLAIPSDDKNYSDVEYLSKYRIENDKKHNILVYDIKDGSQTPSLIALKVTLSEAGNVNGVADKGIMSEPIINAIDENGDNIYR